MHVRISSGWLKFAIGWAVVFAFRLLPFRPPNVEPMLATLMPFSKRFGFLGCFLFGFLGIVLYDAVTSGWGIWTLATALAYGGLGVAAHAYFRNRQPTRGNFVGFAIVGTLAYDGITMLIGPVFTGQSFAVALAGQVPFTILHLAGAILFAAVLSPLLYKWVVENDALEFSFGQKEVVQSVR